MPLGERIRNLFKEQGVTIVSVLTAIGMTIGFIVSKVTGGKTVTPMPKPEPPKPKPKPNLNQNPT